MATPEFIPDGTMMLTMPHDPILLKTEVTTEDEPYCEAANSIDQPTLPYLTEDTWSTSTVYCTIPPDTVGTLRDYLKEAWPRKEIRDYTEQQILPYLTEQFEWTTLLYPLENGWMVLTTGYNTTPHAATEENGDATSMLQTYEVPVAATVMLYYAWGFDRTPEPGNSPVWWWNLVDSGIEMLQRGVDPYIMASLVEDHVLAHQDTRYERDVAGFVNGMRAIWTDHCEANVRWGIRLRLERYPASQDEVKDFAERTARTLRQRWLRDTFPVAMRNRGLEQMMEEDGQYDCHVGDEQYLAEKREYRDRRVSRSRTPHRGPFAYRPQPRDPTRTDDSDSDPAGSSTDPVRPGDRQPAHRDYGPPRTPPSEQADSEFEYESQSWHSTDDQEHHDDPEGDHTYLVQKKWLLKGKTKTPYLTSKQVWHSAQPRNRRETRRALAPRRPGEARSLLSSRCENAPWRQTQAAADTDEVEIELDEEDTAARRPFNGEQDTDEGGEEGSAERLWLMLLGLDPYGGGLAAPATWLTMPMTLPHKVDNIRDTLADQSEEERNEMRGALPNVLEAIQEELLGLLDESQGSSSSAPRPDTPEPPDDSSRAAGNDEVAMMQRTVTGMIRTNKQARGLRDEKMALHQELQTYPPGEASILADRLRRRLQIDRARVEDWASQDAVLAANTELKTEACPPTGEALAAHDEWVAKWMTRLLSRPGPGQSASSGEEALRLSADEAVVEAREQEEAQQEREDEELYRWHQQQLAKEAKESDEQAVQSRLGLSQGPPEKRLRMTVEVRGRRTHYSEFEIGPGEELTLGLSLSEGPHRWLHAGRPVAPETAAELILKEEQRLSRHDPEATEAHLPGREGDRGRECDPPLATVLKNYYLGEKWKSMLRCPEFRGTYASWLSGKTSDDLVLLRYGDSGLLTFRTLVNRGYNQAPSPEECGSPNSAGSEAETEAAEGNVLADTVMDARVAGPDSVDTEVRPTQDAPDESSLVQAPAGREGVQGPTSDMSPVPHDAYLKWTMGVWSDAYVIDNFGDKAFNQLVRRRHSERVLARQRRTEAAAMDRRDLHGADSAASSGSIWCFVRIPGRSISHIAAEVALLTHPHVVLMSSDTGNEQLGLTDVTQMICNVIEIRSKEGNNNGVVLVPDQLLASVFEMKQLFREIYEIYTACPECFANLNTNGIIDMPVVQHLLPPLTAALFKSMPERVRVQICRVVVEGEFCRGGNIDLGTVETEVIFKSMVEGELTRRVVMGKFRGPFQAITYSLPYQARAALPSNFDCDLGYTIGYTAGTFVTQERTGVLVDVTKLKEDVKHWEVFGTPISSLLTFHARGLCSGPPSNCFP
ncbi:PFP-ALPHA [Symbiodinium sp. CCMP2592]|nr:PFP-ALPHA [Symbiodinium sp. CCMP2592]